MEASAAAGPAAPAADGGGDPSQQAGEQQGADQASPDLAAIQQQLSELGPSLEQMRGMLTEQQQAWMQSQEQQPAPDEGQPEQAPDLSFMDPDSPTYNPQHAASALAQIMQEQSQQQVQAAVAPLQNEIRSLQAERQADLLAGEFPDLQDPEIAQNVITKAREYAAMMGNPDVADNPAFWRLVYMSGRAADAANAEQQEQPPAATLEGAGGASPAAPADAQQQVVDGILNADGAGRKVLPF